MNITLALSNDYYRETSEIEVKAYQTADPALCVHKATIINNDKTTTTGKTWNISHAKTGLNILSGYTRREYAIEGARLLSELADWSKITIENAPDWYKVNKDHVLRIKHAVR